MRYALIDGSDVVNVIEWDGQEEYQPSNGHLVVACPDEVSVGWTVTSDGWVAPISIELPAPTEDSTITEAKESALAQLVSLGITDSNARIIVGLPAA